MNVELQHLQPLRLSEMDGGSVEARFQEELQQAREYLAEAGASQSARITITLDLKPHKHAGFLELVSSVSSRIPPRKAANILMMRDGKIMEDNTSRSAAEPGLFPRSADTSPSPEPKNHE